MGNEAGEWIMYGVKWDDLECIHTVEEAIAYINEVGFLPLFKNDIPGFPWKKERRRNTGGVIFRKKTPGYGGRL